MESVLVSGGAGFIGSSITESLIQKGHKVIVLDDLSTGKLNNISHFSNGNNMVFIEGSILDFTLLENIISSHGVSLVSHQAARPSVARSIKEPVETVMVNVIGTVNLFHAAVKCGCRRVVFASSSSVYGDSVELPKRESMSLYPKSHYAASKAAKEMFASTFAAVYGIEIVGLRYFNVYGRRQDPMSDYAAVIPKFITKSLKNEPLPVEGDGLQTRDFTYIDDVVDANLKALMADNVSGMFFNVACGARINILQLATIIMEITQSNSGVIHMPPRPGDVRDSIADIELAGRHLDYYPAFNIRGGLEETVKWFKEHANEWT